ncbi:transporter substrate-binding domain-containing protein [uncultured Roseobacter sp.]|uniref:ATP-binding protein n=1 Tax=uncultured Roseobacter sp. TaxID=114847 RepID=UPI00261FB71C|nr:transporter substrate-binding domain-containing protein [uncultured Roseobacter sp.]
MREHCIRTFKTTGFAALLVIAWTSAVFADQQRLRVAYEQFVPYSFTGPDGSAQGFSIDLITRLANSAGYDLEFVPSPNPAESMRMINSGEADLTSFLALTEARKERGLPSNALGSFELRAFVLQRHSAQTPEDLSGLRVGVTGGSFAVNGAREIPLVQIVEYAYTDDLVLPLLTGEVDAVVGASDSFLGRLRQADVEHRIRMLDPPLISSPAGFFAAPDRPEVQQALNTAIRTSLTDADLRMIYERWFGRSRTLTDHPLFWWAVCATIMVFASLAYFGLSARKHRKYSEQLRRIKAADDLLVSALDEVAAAIVIYDEDLRAIHWNNGFSQSFPTLINDLKSGIDMREIIGKSYRDGTMVGEANAADIDEKVEGIISSVRSGESLARQVKARDGRIFEAREFRLKPGHYASIRVDITRLHQQQDTIEKQTQSLEAANERLATFAAIAAHDLKAPIIQQKVLLNFIREDMEDVGIAVPEPVLEHMNTMHDLCSGMSELIQDLLLYCQTDHASLEKEVISPDDLIACAAAMAHVPPGFSLEIEQDMPNVLVNPTAFKTVMRNLISNAAKHHDKASGRIKVSGSVENGAVLIRIEDDGPGIPDKHKELVFEPFRRLSSASNGNGLGLAYVRKTVEEWGGEVRVADAAPRGSIFSVSFPHRAADIILFSEAG